MISFQMAFCLMIWRTTHFVFNIDYADKDKVRCEGSSILEKKPNRNFLNKYCNYNSICDPLEYMKLPKW